MMKSYYFVSQVCLWDFNQEIQDSMYVIKIDKWN